MTTITGVHIERVIAAPRQRVFEAWLDPNIMAEFLKPAPGVVVIDVGANPTEGGSYGLTMMAGETPIPIRGTYQRIERFELLAFTWLSSRTSDDSLLVLTFEEVDAEHTKLTLLHTGFADESARNDHEGGWSTILSTLDEVLIA